MPAISCSVLNVEFERHQRQDSYNRLIQVANKILNFIYWAVNESNHVCVKQVEWISLRNIGEILHWLIEPCTTTRFGPYRVPADIWGSGEFDFWLIY